MTDKEKLQAIFDAFDISCVEKDKSILAAGRRYYFNEDGEVERIIDYVDVIRATPENRENLC